MHRNLSEWWDGKPFDAILLDAPCSASGVIRRHPDIKLLRRATDIPELARLQAETARGAVAVAGAGRATAVRDLLGTWLQRTMRWLHAFCRNDR